jgi:PPP family 3-phenylpropionic acid transporter
MPTVAAAKAMLDPHVLVFCIGMFFTHMAAITYYSFYPIYLKDCVGLQDQWLGIVSNLGVGIEIFFILGFGWILEKIGLKWLMAAGIFLTAIRLGLLGFSSSIPIAVGTQALHGIMVLAVHVAPPIFLNRHAGDSYRNSMQGLYTMTAYGFGRIVGNLIAGHIAMTSVPWAFRAAAGFCVIASILFAFAFHERPRSVGTSTR